ncbi:MAG: 2Fe-2S iron-sulfur cluster-binding protein [Phycisphaerae bacterium]
MPKITVDGQTIEAKDKQTILQACLDNGIDVPHYCYHPGLSIVASCRICLAEVEGVPKLLPTCQTPVRDGMVVHVNSTKSVANQKQVMEYLLINHPLDCPVCDKAGECLLQDYSYDYGRSVSRFEEDKVKQPKKDIGEHVMLYGDRCIMCTRCVRFTREVTGTNELFVSGRGHREEIDVFPGRGIDNKLSLNVIDICPVGALLDKSFLFKQRVWLLKQVPSISPVDAGGENTWLEHNDGVVYRIKPRYNSDVNQWWISNDTRHAYKALHSENRLKRAGKPEQHAGRDGPLAPARFNDAVEFADIELRRIHKEAGDASLYAMLSPMMPSEEAWLLATYVRSIDPQATLILGPVPVEGENETFFNSETKEQTFEIQAEKVPNRRGVERVMEMLGGPRADFTDVMNNDARLANLKGGWVVGGYLHDWLPTPTPQFLLNGFRVLQDVLPTALTEQVNVLLPSAMWAEKDGTFENHAGRLQAFMQAVTPPGEARVDGEVLHGLLRKKGRYSAQAVREEMGGVFAEVQTPKRPEEVNEPAFEFQEL